MSAPIISVRNLAKQYHLGAALAHDTLRDQLVHFAKSLGRHKAPREPESFWALQDVSFDVQPGEVVGVIGRNGAGKSTLLKILSQITEPTVGEIRIRGRLASLLEVGTGFHPELTGRENIFLNGAILGMSKAEIKSKFDEIVAFAEVEKFLDTPVKRYSSGMYVRLAFAVAAHLEPEILVVDEVLAVGDVQFQSKCLGKMESVAKRGGRTVLFVSHNMTAVQMLCGRAIHLAGGRLVGAGPVEEQIRHYLDDARRSGGEAGSLEAELGKSLQLKKLAFNPTPLTSGEPVEFTLEIAARQETSVQDVCLLIHSLHGVRVAIVDLRSRDGQAYSLHKSQVLRLTGTIRSLPLVEGDYKVGIYVCCEDYYSDFLNLATLPILNRANSGEIVPRETRHRGTVELEFDFQKSILHG